MAIRQIHTSGAVFKKYRDKQNKTNYQALRGLSLKEKEEKFQKYRQMFIEIFKVSAEDLDPLFQRKYKTSYRKKVLTEKYQIADHLYGSFCKYLIHFSILKDESHN